MLVSDFSPRRTRGRFISLVATAALAVGVLGLGAAPASAASGCTLTGAYSGSVGVAQNLTFTGCLGATTLTATYPSNSNSVLTSSISVDSSGAGTHSWTPQNSGVANLSLNASNDNGGILASVNIAASSSPIATTISLVAATTLSVKATATLAAMVFAASGPNAAAGTVTFTDSSNNVLATGTLSEAATRGIAFHSEAIVEWSPTVVGPITITATYNPFAGWTTSSSTKTYVVTANQTPAATPTPWPQSAKYTPRASGPVNKGQTLKLELGSEAGTDTGQNITWKITSSKKKCSLEFPSNGDVKLKIKKKGVCAVTGTAPQFGGLWAPYSISLRYHAK